MKNCPKCNTKHDKPGIFCSRNCANSRIFSVESRIKKSIANKQFFSTEIGKLSHAIGAIKTSKTKIARRSLFKEKYCNNCGKLFKAPRKENGTYRTWCTDQCFLTIKKKNSCGIKREIYKGLMFDSHWEVDIAKYLDKNNIEWVQPSPIYWVDKKGKQRKYYPDFYLPKYELYLDPKNPFCQKLQKEKLDTVKNQIKLFVGSPEQIKEILEGELVWSFQRLPEEQ